MKVSSVIRLKVKEDWAESFTEGLSTRVFWITFRVIPSLSTGSDSCCATVDIWMKRVAIRLGVVISVLVVRVLCRSSGINKLRVQKDWTSFTKSIHVSLIWSTFGLDPSISTGSFALCDYVCIGTWNWRVAIREGVDIHFISQIVAEPSMPAGKEDVAWSLLWRRRLVVHFF